MDTHNTYEITDDGLALVITTPEGEKSISMIADIPKAQHNLVESKRINIENFDSQIKEFDEQIAFILKMQPIPQEEPAPVEETPEVVPTENEETGE